MEKWRLFQSLFLYFPYTALAACLPLKESSLSSLVLSATVLLRYLNALHCTGGSLLMDTVVGRKMKLRRLIKTFWLVDIDSETKLFRSCSKSVHKSLDIIGGVSDQSVIICKEQFSHHTRDWFDFGFESWLHLTSLLLSLFGCKRLPVCISLKATSSTVCSIRFSCICLKQKTISIVLLSLLNSHCDSGIASGVIRAFKRFRNTRERILPITDRREIPR